MLGQICSADAVLLAGDLASMTDAAESMETRLCRLATHYRNRAMQAEDRISYALELLASGYTGEAAMELDRLFGDPSFEISKDPVAVSRHEKRGEATA